MSVYINKYSYIDYILTYKCNETFYMFILIFTICKALLCLLCHLILTTTRKLEWASVIVPISSEERELNCRAEFNYQ